MKQKAIAPKAPAFTTLHTHQAKEPCLSKISSPTTHFAHPHIPLPLILPLLTLALAMDALAIQPHFQNDLAPAGNFPRQPQFTLFLTPDDHGSPLTGAYPLALILKTLLWSVCIFIQLLVIMLARAGLARASSLLNALLPKEGPDQIPDDASSIDLIPDGQEPPNNGPPIPTTELSRKIPDPTQTIPGPSDRSAILRLRLLTKQIALTCVLRTTHRQGVVKKRQPPPAKNLPS